MIKKNIYNNKWWKKGELQKLLERHKGKLHVEFKDKPKLTSLERQIQECSQKNEFSYREKK